MKALVTGATGFVGPRLLRLLDRPTVVSRNPDRARAAIGHLADRILGSKGFVAAWPKDTALKSSQRADLQRLLSRRGYDIGSPDGIIGPKTRAAIMDFQVRAGLIPDGHVSGNLLKALS